MAEEKKIATGLIGNALRSSAADHTTTFTDEVFDTERQKYQSEVNTDIEGKIEEEAEARMQNDQLLSQAIAAEQERAEAAEQANAQGIIYDVSANNGGAVFESLQTLLSSSNLDTLIPVSFRHGGMTIRFIQGYEPNSDNKYVQYRLMSDTFNTTVNNWQGVDDEPTVGSNNLVESGGVYSIIKKLKEDGYLFLGIANTSTSPSIPSAITGVNSKFFYIALEPGVYTNFLNSESQPINTLSKKIYVLKYNSNVGYWSLDYWDILPEEFYNQTIGKTISGQGVITVDVDGLNEGALLSIYMRGDDQRSVYGIKANDKPVSIGVAKKGLNQFTLSADFKKLRFYTASDESSYDLTIYLGYLGDIFKTYDIKDKVDIRYSNNLFDNTDSDVKIGYFIYNNTGTLGGNGTVEYNTSGYVPVVPGTTYYKASNSTHGFRTVLFYDSNKDAITTSYISDDVNNFTAPEGSAYVRVTFYNSDYDYAQISTGGQKPFEPFSEIGEYLRPVYNAIDKVSNRVTSIEEMLEDGSSVITLEDSTGSIFFPSNFGLTKFKKGMIIEVYGSTNGINFLLYGNKGSGNQFIMSKVSQDERFPSLFVLDADYISFMTYSNNATITSSSMKVQSEFSNLRSDVDRVQSIVYTLEFSKECRVVYIGNSYSEMARWITAFESMVNVKEKLNLGISSADLKDIESDRVQYPYTSRPFNGILGSDGTEGNLNVFSCQVEQLKRMKQGNLHGVLWKTTLSNVTGGGTISFAFEEGTETVNISSTDTASDVAEKIAQITTSDYNIVHPSGTDYVLIEALSNSVSSIPAITSAVVTISSSVIKNKEVYPFTNDPNVVIIEGGKNDYPDTDEKVGTYTNQILHQESVYYKRTNTPVQQGTIYVPTNSNTVDRTCFCGSLRHLVEEIHTLYEDALIIVIGPSNLNYGGVDLLSDFTKDEQLAKSAAFLSIPYISWYKNGIMCNRLFNKPNGNGTQSDPYILDSETDYTLDMMHPNDEGGKWLANIVATRIKEFLNYI